MIKIIQRNAIALLCTLLFLLGAGYFTIQLVPIHVLRDWKISVVPGKYQLGSVIPVSSSSSKLRKAEGEAHRTIECNSGKDSVVDYTLNNSQAKRLPGTRITITNLIIPTNITNTPVTCRIVISVTYKVYKIRKITENAVSNDFTVIESKAPVVTKTIYIQSTNLQTELPSQTTTSFQTTSNPQTEPMTASVTTPSAPSEPPVPEISCTLNLLGLCISL